MISPRHKINLSSLFRSPSQKLSDASRIYIPSLSLRKRTPRNNSSGFVISDRNLKENCMLKPFVTGKTRVIHRRKFKADTNRIEIAKHYTRDSRSNNHENCCRVVITDCNQQLEHFIEVTNGKSITSHLKKFYSSIFFKTSPPNILIDYLLMENRLAASFLNGKNLYLKICKKGFINEKISLKHFDIIRPIGSGGFSNVFLCRFKQDGCFYAMKLIDKEFIIKNRKKKIIMNERNVMKMAEHPFLIEMKFAFETDKYLAFVLEYCAGGELFGLIRKYHRINENTARFYIIQILLGLEYLHDRQVVYRDIKPENILLTIDGHIKIADLGLAKPNMSPGELAYSFCGSPEYMSPEMIMQVGHTFPVDHYCMGALLFQLLTGLPPFYSRDPNQIYEAVLSEDFSIPQDVGLTSDCRNLLRALLCKDSKVRLGSMHGIKEILAHPWFGKNDYAKYLKRQVSPPEHFLSFDRLNLDSEIDEKAQKEVDEVVREQNKQKVDKKFKAAMKSFYFDSRTHEIQPEDKENIQKGWLKKIYCKSVKKIDNLQSLSSRRSLKKIWKENQTGRR